MISPVVEVLAPAFLVLAVVRIALLVRPAPGATLPHPSQIPGLPMAGPAFAGGGARGDQSGPVEVAPVVEILVKGVGPMSAQQCDGAIGVKRDAIYLGRYRDPVTGQLGPKIQMAGSEAVVIIVGNRVGKDTGIAIPNALRLVRE